jgi:hypothetical protein
MGKVSVVVRIRPPNSWSSAKGAVQKTSPSSLTVEDTSVYSSPILNDFECDAVLENEELAAIFSEKYLRAGRGDLLVIGYGHSGSGKTYSIFGPGGVVESVSSEFFRKRPSVAFLDVSFLEVYNEKVYDLLTEPVPLQVLEDSQKRVFVKNLTKIRVEDYHQLDTLISVGMAQRAMSENAVHLHSSRSHAILQLTRPSGETIWLCDLAGSERVRRLSSMSVRNENREITSIHKSLHALRRCIMALRGNFHVPARSSVLTRLLFTARHIDRCVVVACIAPDDECVQETLSTLDFAASGLAAHDWTPAPQARSLSEADKLRSALMRVTRELECEKARRIALEQEITRNSTPSFWGQVAPETPLKEDEDCPPVLLDVSDSKSPPIFQDKNHGLLSVHSSPERNQKSNITASPNLEDSVLSQTWRHNQYDAILNRIWTSN